MAEWRSTSQELRNMLGDMAEKPGQPRLTMPASFYTSADFLEVEKREIFRREWVCLGRADEIPQIGDYFTSDLVDEPLLVLRGEDRQVHVLSNVCRHRNLLLAQGAGNATSRRFTCGYHAWTYGLDGRLQRAPNMDGVTGFDAGSCRLPEFPVEIWQGFIFVNLEGKAPSLRGHLDELEMRIGNYHLGDMHLVASQEEKWATNWKCLAENFMEGYHLSYTHPKTLHPITPTSLCRKFPGGDLFTGYEAHFDPKFPDRGKYHPDLTESERRCSQMVWVYPSFVMGLAPHMAVYMCIRPDGVDHLVTRWGIAGQERNPSADLAANWVDLARGYNAEDQEKLERMQIGMRSHFTQRTAMGHDDLMGTVWDFYQYMGRRLAGVPVA